MNFSVLRITACCLLTAAVTVADETVRGFIWEQANAQAMTAAKPEEYLAAASAYNRLALDGVRNGLLFQHRWRHRFEREDGPPEEACRWFKVTPVPFDMIGDLPLI